METFIKQNTDIGAIIGHNIEEEERNRCLSPQVLDVLRREGLLRLYLPKELGGLEQDPQTVAMKVEEISSHNTAAGWAMMVANVSGWWMRALPEAGVEQVFGNGPEVIIAGAFHPPMKATPVDGGFLINGRSPLASNVHEADWIFVTALVMDGDHPKMNNGIPEIIGALMNPGHCDIIDTWHTIGMKATDSNDIDAHDVFVPIHLMFMLNPYAEPNKYYQSSLYKFPAIGIGVCSLIAPVAIAVASNAITELKTLAAQKTSFGSVSALRERGVVQRKLGMAEALVRSSRSYLYQSLEGIWKKVLEGKEISLDEKAGLLLAATHTNQSCLQAVDMVYSAAGSTAIYTRNKLAHYFMDAQVIRQHGFANDSRYETAAQVFIGLQPDLPVLVF
jgi:alkylation response protein AidB-like acyl-CoA dehydrogenase